ncbi:MAG: ThiF family adenylyltransferase [Chloroflexi bacterium]|nr:ThiF family adenylyltransferase [Chloroflexota bacterium]
MTPSWAVRIGDEVFRDLRDHLFPGDGRPHAAALLAGVAHTNVGTRLLIRRLIRATDGVDYSPGTGERGHHRLTADFVRDAVLEAQRDGLAYLAAHVHGGAADEVGFSPDDLRSHERGYPALLDLLQGRPVGALVFSDAAVAGDVWLPGGERATVSHMTVVGARQQIFRPRPLPALIADPTYDRQARIFGSAGQDLLRSMRIGVIGAGGMGMLLIEYLSRLGVGSLVVIDPDRVDETNLPRLPGARAGDAVRIFGHPRWPVWLRRLGAKFAARKVDLAARLARESNRAIEVERIFDDVREPAVASRLRGCDYLLLAANSDQARLIFNAIVHQYLIPGAQVGAKVEVDPADGHVLAVHSIVRTVLPARGCLWCNEVISPIRLAEESAAPAQRRHQRYVDEPDVVAPSVLTLNATAAAIAANDFLFTVTGMTLPDAAPDYARVRPMERTVVFEEPRSDSDCPECSASHGRYALGDLGRRLPTFFREV